MMRVLIVDDHEIVRHGLRDLLHKEFGAVTVGEASDSRAASDWLDRHGWDLVLLDINLPGRSGLDVLADIRQRRPNTPVLVLSAYAEAEFAVRAFKLGAAGYLHKTCAADELLVAAKKIMAGGKYVTLSLAESLVARLGGDLKHAPHEALSHRELQVLRLIAAARTVKEIAAELALSEKTVATYRGRIAEKLGVGSNVEITRYAFHHKLVE